MSNNLTFPIVGGINTPNSIKTSITKGIEIVNNPNKIIKGIEIVKR